MTAHPRDALSAREKLLVEGLHDWLKLWQVHRHVAEENLSSSLEEVQQTVMGLVLSLISEGVAEIGGLREHGARFERWSASPDASLRRLSVEYVDNFHDRAGWPWTVWLRLTDNGKSLGRTHQHTYALWLQDVRARGVEELALPLWLEPGGTQP